MKVRPIQESFIFGEISPWLFNRVTSKYKRGGLASLINMYVLSQGPVKSRGGSYFISEAKVNTSVRLITFATDVGDFCLELGHLYMRVHNEDGRVSGGGLNVIEDNTFHTGFIEWTDKTTGGAANVTFAGDEDSATLHNQGADTAGLNQNVTIDTTGVNFTIRGRKSGDGTLRVMIGTADGLADELDQSVSTNGDWSFTYMPSATDLWVEFRNTGASGTDAVVTLPIFSKDGSAMEFVTPWTLAELPDIHFDQIEGNNEIYFAQHNHPQQHLTYSAGTFAFSAITFTSPPASWTGTEYPDSVAIYQGRSYWSRKRNLWASKPNDYTDMSLGTASAGDAISVALATDANIRWLRSAKELLIGTKQGIYRVAAFQGVIIPSDIDIRKQSRFGTNFIQGIELGDEAGYVSHNNRKLRSMVYDHDNGWKSPDLTWASEHITQGRIKELHFAPNPNDMLMAVTYGGDILSCTYKQSDDPEQQSLGWAVHNNPGIEFKSMCVADGDESSMIYVAGYQPGADKINISVISMHAENHPELDANLVRPVETGDVVTGLEHLEGETVSVLIDGATHADKTVVGGEITLDESGDLATVGLGYTQYMKTLPVDIGSPQGSGSSLKKHWNNIFIRLFQSAIYPNVNGQAPDDRSVETPMDSPEPFVTVDVRVSSLGWSRAGQIEIEQPLPVPTTVLGIFGEMAQKGL